MKEGAELKLSAGILRPLRSIRCDSVQQFAGGLRVAYVVDYPSPALLRKRSLRLVRPMGSIKKKASLLKRLPVGSTIVSPGVVDADTVRLRRKLWHRSAFEEGVHHLSWLDVPLLSRFASSLILLSWLLRHARSFDAILCYNSYAHTLLPSLLAARLLKKPLLIDWQDDYRSQPGNHLTRWLWPVAESAASGGIATNANMLRPGMTNWIVVEAYCDFTDLPCANFVFRRGQRFLFSGTLDRIRGAHLLTEVVAALDVVVGDFTLDVTGGGSEASAVAALASRDARVRYHGFVGDEMLNTLVAAADACLVLQDPRQPFTKGSFPSKVETYAEYRKAVLVLEEHHPCSSPAASFIGPEGTVA